MKLIGLSLVSLALFFTFAQAQTQVTIGHITIVDTPGITQRELNRISHEVEGRTCSTKDAGRFIEEQVLEAFQARGYFRAAVLEPRLKPSRDGKADANVVVEPGAQYWLHDLEVRFAGQPVLSKTELAPLIAAHAGTIFNVRTLQQTIENLRNYYDAHSFLGTAIWPQSVVDDQKHEITIALQIHPQN
jgi:outer membrane protein assembly factor BamA